MTKARTRFTDIKDFGLHLGLNEIEMELILQKKKIIEKLKAARESKGITQTKLAEVLESKQPAIARMESGQISEVSMDFLCKVAMALGVDLTIKGKVA